MRCPELAEGAGRCRLSLRMLHQPLAVPHQLQANTAWPGEKHKEREQKGLLGQILDNCRSVLHGAGFLRDVLWHCVGQEVLSSWVCRACAVGSQAFQGFPKTLLGV